MRSDTNAGKVSKLFVFFERENFFGVRSLVICNPWVIVWAVCAGGHVPKLRDPVLVGMCHLARGWVPAGLIPTQVVALTNKLPGKNP